MSASSVTDAATIIILREAARGFEVFMVRRHSKSQFMANRYVYPGGKLDAADSTEVAARHVEGLTPKQARERLAEEVDPSTALGLFLAGIRETFEEAGILLARRAGEDDLIDLTSDEEVAERFRVYRKQLMEGDISLSEVAERESLVFPLDRLGYFAHWITPYVEPRRFDARFFVAIAPDSQRPLHDKRETTASAWIRPADAVAQNQAGEFMLAPPTLRTLQQLAEFESAEAAFEWALDHDPPTILPHMEQRDEHIWLFLPGDDEFPADDAEYAMAEPVDDGVTRMVAENVGLWRVVPQNHP
ncbi:NUDIX hydrolase [Persicimonas caeni]|uniref:NUDIX hydrolase n=1 Tax=Persicimonas caeni TaxID=2292766 RepID=A0A4Y6PT94_PERCE|nr:NUDIX hydrolase [Persicimonas caeni]QDG51554.1 NUDIX hydrolase [Persicimonas caeni]QED32775.1 NUDIX hydrolase [Persicimonas caeni]